MLYPFSLPTKSDKVPTGCDWIHEIKYDGYRMMLIREQDRVRLVSRGGYDWADRFPLIVSAALKLPDAPARASGSKDYRRKRQSKLDSLGPTGMLKGRQQTF
jgi:ATP-dependent DNA ligase